MDFSAPLEGTEDRVVRPDGTQIRTVVVGDGDRDVVLAHGYGFSLDSWNLVAPLLVSSGHRVIAFDQRGHAGSTTGSQGIGSLQMASDYAAVMEHHRVSDQHAVANVVGRSPSCWRIRMWSQNGLPGCS